MPEDFRVDLSGRCALVTGGSRGIGRAFALALAQCGANVGIVYRRDDSAAQSTLEDLQTFGIASLAVKGDVADEYQVQRIVGEAWSVFGGIDILVNNAGTQRRIPFLDITYEEWRSILRTNLDGYFLMGQAVARYMVRNGRGGVIVNVSSVNQSVVAPFLTHYNVSKAGVFALTRQMAYELAPCGIRVNAIAPGLTETDLNRADLADPHYREQRLSRIPLGFIAEPTDLVGALLYLVSDAARYVTGSCIIVDGGHSLLGPPSMPGIDSR